MPKDYGSILDGLVEQLRTAELLADEKEAELKEAKAKVRQIVEHDIPSIMAEIGLDKLETPRGHTVSVKPDPKGEVNKSDWDNFITWLDEHGHGGIVKRNLLVAFDKDSKEETEALLATLREEGRDAKMDGSIHYQTLQAWVRARLKDGDELPDFMKIYDRRVASVR